MISCVLYLDVSSMQTHLDSCYDNVWFCSCILICDDVSRIFKVYSLLRRASNWQKRAKKMPSV